MVVGQHPVVQRSPKLDFVHLGGVGEDVGELSVNCGWGFSAVGVETRQCNISVGQPQHEVRRFRHVSNFCTKSSEGSDRKLHSVAVTGTGWPNCHPASFSDLDWVKLCRANDNVGRAIMSMSMSMSMSRVFAGRIIPGLLAYSSKAPLPVAPPTNASTGAVPPKPTETSRSFRSVAYAGRCRLAHRDSPELLLQLPYAGMTFLIPS